MLGRLNVGGGSKINGLIEEYVVASDGNVNAGDFVKFVNDSSVSTQLSTSMYSGKSISAVALSSNKIFIAHADGEHNLLYGLVCKIDNNIITKGTELLLDYASYSGLIISVVALSSNKVFVVHEGGTNNNTLIGAICTIEETTITKETGTTLILSTNLYKTSFSAVALSSEKIFITYNYGEDELLYGFVCTISGTAISKGKNTKLSSKLVSANNLSTTALSPNKVFIAHMYGSGDLFPSGLVCTIDGTNITKGVDTRLISFSTCGDITVTMALSIDKVLFVYTSGGKLYSTICTIDETNIIPGTDILLESDKYISGGLSAVMISPNKIFVIYSTGSNCNGLVCTIDETNITAYEDTILGSLVGKIPVATALSLGKVFIAYNFGSLEYLYGIAHATYNAVKTVDSLEDTIIGVAKIKGTSGQIVKVYVPDV